jgi:Xaa-Pro aminopeptidase
MAEMSSYADRLAALREQLKSEHLDGFVVPLTDEHMSEYVGSYAQRLAWLTGFQGSAGSAVVLPQEAAIFVDGRYTLQVRQQVSADEWSYQSVPETSVAEWLKDHAPEGGRIGYDPWLHTREWVKRAKEALARAGAKVVPMRDPTILPKALKNPAEIAGQKAAQERDGAVISKFLHWIDEEAPKGDVDELKASDHLEALRRENPELRDLSFDSISGAGPNGAIVHYRSSEKTNRKLEEGTLYLIDSGGQYVDGTTDITRTVAIGEPTAEMRDRFTRVLKGHIAIATSVFPRGTRGSQLDSFARRPLWEAGLDYAHGTGHGVGSFLAVHEGPQRISPVGSAQSGGDEPLQPGMIISNEPGYYKTGEYGIRIENLVLVVPREIEGAEKEMLGFETLTFAPIDRRLIDAEMLEPEELVWLNCYHAHVMAKIGPRLQGADLDWLRRACAPIAMD